MGDPSGFGIYVAFSKQRSMSILPNLKEKEQEYGGGYLLGDSTISLNTSNVRGRELNDDIKPIDEYYYEGEFVDGYKHGIGRYFEPDGSYYYCQWLFDRKTDLVLYYNV